MKPKNGRASISEKYLAKLRGVLCSMPERDIIALAEIISSAGDRGNVVYIFGNGGSAATSSHIASDLNKCYSVEKKKRLKVLCLNDNIPAMLAHANDYSYERIFTEQLRGVVGPGDVVIGISGSGNSKNILGAIRYANSRNALTVGVCGFSGGKLKKLVCQSVHIAVDDMQIAEDLHLVAGHIMMKYFMGK